MSDASSSDRNALWNDAYESGLYRKHWQYHNPSQELVALIAAELPRSGARVLDIGCGAGTEAVFLARCGFQVIAVDVSEAAVAIAEHAAREAGVEVTFHVASVFNMPIVDGSISFINDRGLFHCIPQDKRAHYMREVERVLEPGAALAIRGAGEDSEEEGFFAVTGESIDAAILASGTISADTPSEPDTPATLVSLTRGPVLPITLLSDKGSLQANMVVVRKRCRRVSDPVSGPASVRVEGIGGVFFKSRTPKELQAWYQKHLGVPVDADGLVDFAWRHADAPGRMGHTVWSAFKDDTRYFDPSQASFMINYRVSDLDAAIATLRANGVQIVGEVEVTEYGKFGWCMDAEGNKIELWQPREG